MTAWQDQPPQTRRQLRLSEQRDGAHEDGTESANPEERVDMSLEDAHLAAAQTPTPRIETFARSEWDAPAPRSSAHEGQAPTHQQPRSRAEAAIASGRRSQHSFPQAAPQDSESPDGGAARESTDTSPSTQVPSYRGPSFGASALLNAAQPNAQPTAGNVEALRPRRAESTEARRIDDTPPAYRIRDFSPESRRSAFSSTSELAPSDWNRSGASGEPANLEYHTQQGLAQHPETEAVRNEPTPLSDGPSALSPVSAASSASFVAEPSVLPVEVAPASLSPVTTPSPVTPSPATPLPASQSLADTRSAGREASAPHAEHTLTRRELRAMRQTEEPAAEAPAENIAVENVAVVEAPVVMAAAQEAAEVAVEAVAQVQAPPPLRTPEAPAPQSSQELSRAMAEFDALMAHDSVAGPASAEPAAVRLPFVVPESAVQSPAPSVPTVVDSNDAPSDEESHSAAQPAASLQASERGIDTQAVDSGKIYTVPTGHWSTQGALDDEVQPDGVTLSRNIAATSGAVTASHLVISSVPTANDLLLPFSSTGEIMITGTIELPRSLGTTGAHPARYDHSDVDALLEASDREDSNVDSAPVRAIRAVSTHTSSRGLIGTAKPPRSSRLPMVLAISTAAVAAVVVVLFVAGFVLHIF